MSKTYYNEIDNYAADWLENLIAAGHIAPGVVDRRSIEDVRPDDLRGFRQCHFFAGIGVWSYALRRAGVPDDFAVWTGSCPCQPFSAAGKRGGLDDERHLWPHWFHLIRECRPGVVLGEQVASKDGLAWSDIVQADLEAAGYACGFVDTCSAGSGAPHIRQRLRFVAERVGHPDSPRAATWVPEQAKRKEGHAEVYDHGSDRLFRPDPRRSASGRMADANGRDTSAERQQRGGEQRFEPQDGGAGGVADDTLSGRREECSDTGRQLARDRAQGLAAGSGAGSGDRRPGPTNGFWRDADWLFCRDGKWRPVEPGTFPLAHGAPARVGRLRAYGNAVDAEATRIFIESYLDTRTIEVA